MKIKLVEATNNNQNWGKFLLGKFDSELEYRSKIDEGLLIRGRGWDKDHLMVFDLQTGEGALFKLGGHAVYDLKKHRIWVCPLFEPFLELLYQGHRNGMDLFDLPDLVNMPNAPFDTAGYRRAGPEDDIIDEVKTAIAAQCSCHQAGCIHDKIREVFRTYKPEQP